MIRKASKRRDINHAEISRAVAAGHPDIISAFAALGVIFPNREPRSSGCCECYSVDKNAEQRTPSAYVNVNTAHYHDSSVTANGLNSKRSIPIWQLAVNLGKFAGTWEEARQSYAEEANVDLTQFGVMVKGSGKKKSRRPKQSAAAKREVVGNAGATAGGVVVSGSDGDESDQSPAAKKPLRKQRHWSEQLDFEPWTPTNERFAYRWGAQYKKPISIESIRLCGGRVAWFKRYKDEKTGEWVRDKCIAMPCYGEQLTTAEPVAWVIWRIDGKDFQFGKDKKTGEPKPPRKMNSVGLTGGTLMGEFALRLLDPHGTPSGPLATPATTPIVFKTAGPPDMLALVTAIISSPSMSHRNMLAVCEASGEGGSIAPHVPPVFAGNRVCLVGDRDDAGQVGVANWAAALDRIAVEVVERPLPFAFRKKGGSDLRDFLNGVTEETPAIAES